MCEDVSVFVCVWGCQLSMLYFYVFVFVCVRGWGEGPCIDWVIWVWCAVVQLESRVWGQRHNGRGIREGVFVMGIYMEGEICGLLSTFCVVFFKS